MRDALAIVGLGAWSGCRADEVKETYRQEGVSHEASYLIETRRGWILVFAAEVEDREVHPHVRPIGPS